MNSYEFNKHLLRVCHLPDYMPSRMGIQRHKSCPLRAQWKGQISTWILHMLWDNHIYRVYDRAHRETEVKMGVRKDIIVDIPLELSLDRPIGTRIWAFSFAVGPINIISRGNKLFRERRYLEEWISMLALHRLTWRTFRLIAILGSTSRITDLVHLGWDLNTVLLLVTFCQWS